MLEQYLQHKVKISITKIKYMFNFIYIYIFTNIFFAKIVLCLRK